jgi:hypothetical protein
MTKPAAPSCQPQTESIVSAEILVIWVLKNFVVANVLRSLGAAKSYLGIHET